MQGVEGFRVEVKGQLRLWDRVVLDSRVALTLALHMQAHRHTCSLGEGLSKVYDAVAGHGYIWEER